MVASGWLDFWYDWGVPKAVRAKRSRSSRKSDSASAAPAVDDLMCEFMGVAKAIKRFMEQRFSENKFPPSLSGPRMGVLFHVQRNGGLRMGDLAERLGVAARTVTDLVDGLERDGLLLRREDPADRRATLLDLTPRARVDFERAHAASRSFLAEAFSPLTGAERKQFLQLLNKLRRGPIGKSPVGFASDPCRSSD